MTQAVGVDFDGVIHAYSMGWHDGTIYDEPVPGAFDALRGLTWRPGDSYPAVRRVTMIPTPPRPRTGPRASRRGA